ncbi:hypothetical protein ASPVEDRAFT_479451 [Aspergillus versicolor CBS 583.65]|uniref:Uncharacterized protein n=1 Tax=Aspergillus versicolor CBS 583.65 TaxID=1036611 RepID=A0A1L9PAX6_ASPVE|nr:uncharacterized protein ASPVEDRAFT_479451 [Aspergillus versicolor CBS 583.65]OJI98687.1 hypothetical protein ASPVEDRAFT_479451 [Aspergillus versicolor CBS 583.65]
MLMTEQSLDLGWTYITSRVAVILHYFSFPFSPYASIGMRLELFFSRSFLLCVKFPHLFVSCMPIARLVFVFFLPVALLRGSTMSEYLMRGRHCSLRLIKCQMTHPIIYGLPIQSAIEVTYESSQVFKWIGMTISGHVIF